MSAERVGRSSGMMSTTVLRPYDQMRARMVEALLSMASHAEEALALATRVLMERDDTLIDRVQASDAILDQHQHDVDELAVQLLAMAPLARELRLITVAMKISHNLERVGEEAEEIAAAAGALMADAPLKPYVDLPAMSATAREMLNDAITAFVEAKSSRARALLPRDHHVDDLNRQLHRELASFMIERPANIPRCLHLMGIAKAFERVADHATNIAEEVVFLYEGIDIRHGAAS